MNKTALATILGSALLGLAKSKSKGSNVRLKVETISELDLNFNIFFEWDGEDIDDEFEGFIYSLKTLPKVHQLSANEKVEIKFNTISWNRSHPYYPSGQTILSFNVKLISLYVPVDEDGNNIHIEDYDAYVNDSVDFDDFIYNEIDKAKDFVLGIVEDCADKNYVVHKDIYIDTYEQEYVSLARYILNANTGELYQPPKANMTSLRKR